VTGTGNGNGLAAARVVFVIESFWPEVGGLQRSTQRLAEHLVQRGHVVTVVTRQVPGAASPERRHGVVIHRLPDGPGTFTTEAARPGLLADADVICVFGVGSDVTASWWRPVLDSRHAVRLLKPGTERDLSIVGVPAAMLRRFDGLLCQTSEIASEAQRLGVPARACFPVRNGLDLGAWRDDMPGRGDARAQLDVGDDAFCVLGLGRFIRRKRFGDLVHAFAGLARAATSSNGHALTLLLHGSGFGLPGDVEAELRHRVSSVAGSAHVRFVSPRVDPRVTLAAADVLAVCSEREGAPNVFVEAFASGCPVIATDLTGHRVYVQHGCQGLLVPVGDVAAQATALRDIHRRPHARQAMAGAAAATAARFDISHAADDYLRAFRLARQIRDGSPPTQDRRSPPAAGSVPQHGGVHQR
jgi:glycosyltransferase involved in cell wall biosynthesis